MQVYRLASATEQILYLTVSSSRIGKEDGSLPPLEGSLCLALIEPRESKPAYVSRLPSITSDRTKLISRTGHADVIPSRKYFEGFRLVPLTTTLFYTL